MGRCGGGNIFFFWGPHFLKHMSFDFLILDFNLDFDGLFLFFVPPPFFSSHGRSALQRSRTYFSLRSKLKINHLHRFHYL